MKKSLFLLLLVSLFILHSYSAPSEDQVHMPIPGYNQHKWYSGYLHFDMGKFHYIFFQSQRDPDNDPVVLWLNGGPGCSSLIGMVYQNGPFLFKAGTTNLQINQFSWNKKANILYLQSPGGVGFSQGLRNNTYNDGTVAIDNLNALIDFFVTKFPNLKKNDFYLSGQSYAGIYVPYLALQIIKYNQLPNRKLTFNLKGILVGNACTDPRQCYQPGSDDVLSVYQYQFLYQHGFYTDLQYNNMKAVCLMGYHSEACQAVKKVLDKKFADCKVSLLNIYQKCFPPTNQQSEKKKKLMMQNGRKLNLQVFPDCDDALGITHFFNEPLIHDYLHVDPIRYEMCSSQVGDNYQMFSNSSYWIYPLLIKEKLRIWVYSGDIDSSVPITGTIIWLKRLREQFHMPIEQPWRQWWVPGLHKHQDQVGGMTWQLRGLTFASVKGAGHMAPKDNKKSAFILFDSFINGIQLPFKQEQ